MGKVGGDPWPPKRSTEVTTTFGRFVTDFCIVMAIYGGAILFVDLPGDGMAALFNGVLAGGFVALLAITFKNN